MDHESHISLLVAEDDDDDFLLIEKALASAGLKHHTVSRFTDGETLMNFLRQYQATKHLPKNQRAMVILLDLNMPRKDGRQVLREIKAHPDWRRIPVIVLTTSPAETDIEITYGLGANAYTMKPSNFSDFEALMKTLAIHWLKTVLVPTI